MIMLGKSPLALSCAFVYLIMLHGQVLAASTCTDCHGMPPIDAAYRNITTGGFKGSHQTHQPAVATANQCAICHTGSGAYLTDHMDGVVNLSSNLNSSPVAATYSKGVFFNQTSNPVMGSCSSVNCHFEKITPAWSSTKFVAPADCSGCHGNPPADGNHPAASGAGKKHGDYYGLGTTSCGKCHPDHALEASPFSHASSAGNRGLILAFSAAPNSGGSYSKTANLAYPTYLPSQTLAANRNGSCSSMYCHSDGAGGAPKTVATWGGTLPADCTGCHGGNAVSVSVIASGVHGAHINNATVIGANYECVACHSGVVGAGNDRLITSLANHVTGSKDVTFSGGGTYTAASKNCASTVCHSSGKASAPQPAPPAWTGAALGCNGCHGTSNSLGMPDYANGGAAAALANSHAKHVSLATDCVLCHANTTVTGTAIKAASALHANGAIDVTLNTADGKVGTAATWAAGTKTCANVYCHGATLTGGTSKSPVWGSSLSGCGTCHGYPPATSTHSGVTPTQCINCHTHVNASGTGFTNAALHMNGTVDASGGDCTACHGSQQGTGTRRVVGVDTALASRHIAAATANQASCQVCHEQATFGHMVAGDVAVGMYNQDTGAAIAFDGTTANNGEVGCVSCHDANGASRLGANALKPFADSGDNAAPANVGWTAGAMAHSAKMACFNCHGKSGPAGTTLDPKYNAHGSATAKMLQDTNYNAASPNAYCNNCHDAASSNANKAASDVKGQLAKTYKHSTATCYDCHGSGIHAMKSGGHTLGSTTIAANLATAIGKTITFNAANWGGGATIGANKTATREYEICMKCHAGASLPAGTGAASFTDVSLEFNPNNKSFHPVAMPLGAGTGSTLRLSAAQLTGGWTPGMTMTCSDCHGTDTAGAKGPHGSGVKWMLVGTNKAWPYNNSTLNGTSGNTGFITGSGSSTAPTATGGVFCFNCHVWSAAGAPHTRGDHRIACVACHIRVPHGGKVSRLIATSTAGLPARYKPDGNGGGTVSITQFKKATTPGSYSQSNCNTSCGGHGTVTSPETW